MVLEGQVCFSYSGHNVSVSVMGGWAYLGPLLQSSPCPSSHWVLFLCTLLWDQNCPPQLHSHPFERPGRDGVCLSPPLCWLPQPSPSPVASSSRNLLTLSSG